MENAFARYEGISACWIEKCTFISGIVAMARNGKLPSMEPGHRWRWRPLCGSAQSHRTVPDILERTGKIKHPWVALVHKSVSAAGWGGYRGCPAVESPHAV